MVTFRDFRTYSKKDTQTVAVAEQTVKYILVPLRTR